MLRPSALVLAALLSSRSLWQAFVEHNLPVADAVLWFLVAVPVSALLLAGLRSLMSSYRKANQRDVPPIREQ
jgi:hypothetical protein